MSFLCHPDAEYHQDLADEQRHAEEEQAIAVALLTPLPCGRSELPGIGPKTRQVVAEKRVAGARAAALDETVFGPARRRVAEAKARVLGRRA